MHPAAVTRNPSASPAIWPSVARLAATSVVFFYHYSGLLGASHSRLGSFAVMIFCFLSGYLASVTKSGRPAWFIKRYLGIMIPYWLVIVPVIIANQVFQYKPVGLWTQIVTILGGNLFLDNPLYVIAWYVTFVILLYAYAVAESFCNSWQKLICMIIGATLFYVWSEVGKYFLAFVVGLRLADWRPLRSSAQLNSALRRVAGAFFVIQRYCYPFFLVHGAVLLLFAKKTSVSAINLFWLSLATAVMLSVILYAVSRPLQRFVVDTTLRLIARVPLGHSE